MAFRILVFPNAVMRIAREKMGEDSKESIIVHIVDNLAAWPWANKALDTPRLESILPITKLFIFNLLNFDVPFSDIS